MDGAAGPQQQVEQADAVRRAAGPGQADDEIGGWHKSMVPGRRTGYYAAETLPRHRRTARAARPQAARTKAGSGTGVKVTTIDCGPGPVPETTADGACEPGNVGPLKVNRFSALPGPARTVWSGKNWLVTLLNPAMPPAKVAIVYGVGVGDEAKLIGSSL